MTLKADRVLSRVEARVEVMSSRTKSRSNVVRAGSLFSTRQAGRFVVRIGLVALATHPFWLILRRRLELFFRFIVRSILETAFCKSKGIGDIPPEDLSSSHLQLDDHSQHNWKE